jgi:polyisoprenoid-binding protein YceI
MVVSRVKGSFNDFTGTINFDGQNWKDASVTITARAASIDTDNEKRDNHLRSDDFLNAEKYPELTFVSKEVTKGEGNRFTITGDLTIRDVTREVTFDCEFFGTTQDPWGNTRAGFAAQTTIDRQEFGVSWNNTLDAGGLVVSDEVEIMLEIEAVKEA